MKSRKHTMNLKGRDELKLILKICTIFIILAIAFGLWKQNEGTPSFLWNILKNEQVANSGNIVHVTRQDGSVQDIELEVYLEGVVGSEMPVSFEVEALKAQSVAARTFVMQRGMRVDDTVSTQVYHDEAQLQQIWGNNYTQYHTKVKEAIKATQGEVLLYEGKLISAVFFSSTCGKSANSEEYWDKNTPYLRSVDSSWDASMSGFEKTININDDDFKNKLGFEQNVREVGAPIYYESGYVKSITIDQISFSGRAIREKLGLRSSSFQIREVDGGYDITTKGYGHGIGMSQMGAQYLAKEGKGYKEILKHYYSGVQIHKN